MTSLADPATVSCRAKLDDQPCYHGRPVSEAYPDEPIVMNRQVDGTYDERDGTVVCDPCYLALFSFTRSGAGGLEELDGAIDHYRQQLAYLRAHADPQVLRKEAEAGAAAAAADTPLGASARALVGMVDREVARRRGGAPS